LTKFRAELPFERPARPEEGNFMRLARIFVFCSFSLFSLSSASAADQALIDAAKKEGSVTWYTTLTINQLGRPLAEAFEKKYGIKVDMTRADSAEVALRLHNEAQAGKVRADVFDGSTGTASLKKEGVVMRWLPDAARRFPKELVDADGYWIAHRLIVLTTGYNTELLPKAKAPRTWDDLLDPQWQGKMAWGANVSSSAAPGFIGLVLAERGEQQGMDYLRRLAKQNIAGLKIAARSVLDQVIAGEYAIALQIFDDNVVISRRAGAPVDWVPMNPALAVLSVISVTQNAPHPNAGKLLVDFVVGPEGQTIARDNDYLPVDPDIAPRDPYVRPDGKTFRAIYMTPEKVEEELPKWMQIYDELFR
jgi:ABC-type Fe3+ transport system substrate-binding protein